MILFNLEIKSLYYAILLTGNHIVYYFIVSVHQYLPSHDRHDNSFDENEIAH